jgi:hypothetical protein
MRRAGLIAVVALLVGLNVWRWWPADSTARSPTEAPGGTVGVQAQQLAVRTSLGEPAPPLARNIFQMGRAARGPRATSTLLSASVSASLPRQHARVVAPAAQPVPEPPVRTPEELEADAAQVEFGQLKLVGVIFRDAKPHAYFAQGNQTYLVSVGDTVGRFRVAAITAENARLHDLVTNVGGMIPVLGK